MLLRTDEDFNQENMSWTSAAHWFSFNSIQSGKKKGQCVWETVLSVFSQNLRILVLLLKVLDTTCQPGGKWWKERKSK